MDQRYLYPLIPVKCGRSVPRRTPSCDVGRVGLTPTDHPNFFRPISFPVGERRYPALRADSQQGFFRPLKLDNKEPIVKRKLDGFEPKHKPIIESIVECIANCLLVDGILVPHCNCQSHGGLFGTAVAT